MRIISRQSSIQSFFMVLIHCIRMIPSSGSFEQKKNTKTTRNLELIEKLSFSVVVYLWWYFLRFMIYEAFVSRYLSIEYLAYLKFHFAKYGWIWRYPTKKCSIHLQLSNMECWHEIHQEKLINTVKLSKLLE